MVDFEKKTILGDVVTYDSKPVLNAGNVVVTAAEDVEEDVYRGMLCMTLYCRYAMYCRCIV